MLLIKSWIIFLSFTFSFKLIAQEKIARPMPTFEENYCRFLAGKELVDFLNDKLSIFDSGEQTSYPFFNAEINALMSQLDDFTSIGACSVQSGEPIVNRPNQSYLRFVEEFSRWGLFYRLAELEYGSSRLEKMFLGAPFNGRLIQETRLKIIKSTFDLLVGDEVQLHTLHYIGDKSIFVKNFETENDLFIWIESELLANSTAYQDTLNGRSSIIRSFVIDVAANFIFTNEHLYLIGAN